MRAHQYSTPESQADGDVRQVADAVRERRARHDQPMKAAAARPAGEAQRPHDEARGSRRCSRRPTGPAGGGSPAVDRRSGTAVADPRSLIMPTLFLPARPPQTVSLRRSRAGYSAHALGVPYLPADAKGLYRLLTQAPTVTKSPHVRTACGNLPTRMTHSLSTPVAWGARDRAPTRKGGRESTRGPYASRCTEHPNRRENRGACG